MFTGKTVFAQLMSLIIYNSMKLERLEMDNRKRFRMEEYRNLGKFYENRIQQIHIVGEYARKMIGDYKEGRRKSPVISLRPNSYSFSESCLRHSFR